MIRAVRGAVGIEHDNEKDIHSGACSLVREILRRNEIEEQAIVSILFSVTKDLRKGNPATGLRRDGFVDTPLFCVQEAEIEGALPRVIRVLLTYSTQHSGVPVAVYLGRAAALRPDLTTPADGEVQR